MGTAITAKIITGMTVHRISNLVFPCICFGSGLSGFSLKTKTDRSKAPWTITKITTAIQKVNQNNSSIDLA